MFGVFLGRKTLTSHCLECEERLEMLEFSLWIWGVGAPSKGQLRTGMGNRPIRSSGRDPKLRHDWDSQTPLVSIRGGGRNGREKGACPV